MAKSEEEMGECLPRLIAWRECGWAGESRLREEVSRRRALGVSRLSPRVDFISKSRANLTSLAAERSDSRYALAGSLDGSVAAYDLWAIENGVGSHGRAGIKPTWRARGHDAGISGVAWHSVDSGACYSVGFDGFASVWDASRGVPVIAISLPGKAFAVAVSPIAKKHNLVAVGAVDPAVRILDPASGTEALTLKGHSSSVTATEWSKSGEYELITGSADGSVRLWDLRSPGSALVFDRYKAQEPRRDRETPSSGRNGGVSVDATAHSGYVHGIVALPDGQRALTYGADGMVRLWDIAHAENLLVHFERGPQAKKGLCPKGAVSEDGSALYLPVRQSVKVLATETGKLVNILKGHVGSVMACESLPVPGEVLTGGNDRQLLLFDAPTVGDLEREEEADQDCWSD